MSWSRAGDEPGEYLVTIEAGGERMRRTVRVERAWTDPASDRAETRQQEERR